MPRLTLLLVEERDFPQYAELTAVDDCGIHVMVIKVGGLSIVGVTVLVYLALAVMAIRPHVYYGLTSICNTVYKRKERERYGEETTG